MHYFNVWLLQILYGVCKEHAQLCGETTRVQFIETCLCWYRINRAEKMMLYNEECTYRWLVKLGKFCGIELLSKFSKPTRTTHYFAQNMGMNVGTDNNRQLTRETFKLEAAAAFSEKLSVCCCMLSLSFPWTVFCRFLRRKSFLRKESRRTIFQNVLLLTGISADQSNRSALEFHLSPTSESIKAVLQ